LGFVFQDYALLPELNALENVSLPMIMQGVSKEEAFNKGRLALKRIGIGDKERNLPSELSGGQQ
jgi:putative ABC transport system ATP-binding protein